MTTPREPSLPNLPPRQALTQQLVDAFNADEAAWRERLRKALAGNRKRPGPHKGREQ